MRAALYTLAFILRHVLIGKHSMAEAMDVYHFTKTMICVDKVKRQR